MDFPSHFLGLAGLVVLGLVLWYTHSRRSSTSTRISTPPEPPGAWPLIGHLHLLQGDVSIFRTLGAMADRIGPVFRLRLGMYRTVIVSDRNAVRECFTTNDKALASRPTSAASKILAYNHTALAIAPYGPLWREMRKLCALEIFSSRRLAQLTPVRGLELELGVKDLYMLGEGDGWENPRKVVISDWFEHLVFNVTLRMIAGKRYFNNLVHGGQELGSPVAAIRKVAELFGVPVASDAIPFLEFLDLKGRLSSMKHVADEMDSIIQTWVEEHKSPALDNDGTRKDFIDTLLAKLKDDSLFGYSRETIIKATVLTMIAAGTETTSNTTIWLISALLNNPQAMKQAQEELDLKVGRERWVEQSDIQNLDYLQAMVKEALRLYPAAPLLLPHEAIEDCHVGGYYIPKGTRLLVNAWKLHRDPAVWSDPEEFRPERFLTSHKHVDVSGQDFELIPFGSGRRSCPGLAMALQTLHLTIGRLLQGFELNRTSDSPVDMRERISLTMTKATPVEVMLKPRLHRELYRCHEN